MQNLPAGVYILTLSSDKLEGELWVWLSIRGRGYQSNASKH